MKKGQKNHLFILECHHIRKQIQKGLSYFWSIIGDCIEERKEFTFQCESEDEADELTILTWTLVFQIDDQWEVYLDSPIIIAFPPQQSEEK